MRRLAEAFFSDSPAMGYPIMSLLLFILVFAVLIIRVMRKDKGQMSAMAAMPLADDSTQPQGGDHGQG